MKNTIEEQIEKLFAKSKEIESWMKEHWNSDNQTTREMRRRYWAIMDEINLLLDNHQIKQL